MFRIKICGITVEEDLERASEYGADAVGFNFYPMSARFVDIAKCRKMINRVRPKVILVGVFVNEAADIINQTAEYTGLDMVQLSGDEDESLPGKIARNTIKVVRPATVADARKAEYSKADWIMFDTPDTGAFGGSGLTFDHGIIKASGIKRPFILAGGLTPFNVWEIIKEVRPYGVDVASGVESAPGRKDPEKMRRFIDTSMEALSAGGVREKE